MRLTTDDNTTKVDVIDKIETNSIKEEIALERQKVKEKPLKEQLSYFIRYHKVHIILTIVIALCAFYLISSIIGTKPLSFQCFIINSFGLDSQALSNEFVEYSNLDNEHYDCNIVTSYSLTPKLTSTYELATSQAIDAQIGKANLDVMVMDSSCFYQYALESYFYDLRLVLSDEELEAYEDYFYYIDMKDYEIALENADEFGIDISHITSLTTTDEKNAEGISHLDPSDMTDPVPVGIIITDSPFVQQTETYSDTVAVLGIVANSSRIDTSVNFIDFIFDKNKKWESVY